MIIGYLYCHQFCYDLYSTYDLYNTFCYDLYSTLKIVDEKGIIFAPFIFMLWNVALDFTRELWVKVLGLT